MEKLVFHYHGTTGNDDMMSPTYYVSGEFSKVAVRVYAEDAPIRDAKIDILDDGVSIFTNKSFQRWDETTGKETTLADNYSVILPKGENSDEIADDFNTTEIVDGSWLSCKLVDAGGGSNFTVQLELYQESEDIEED